MVCNNIHNNFLTISICQENVRLKEQNDDLQAQVLGMQVREGRNLLATSGCTLAEEMQTLPRDEVRTWKGLMSDLEAICDSGNQVSTVY